MLPLFSATTLRIVALVSLGLAIAAGAAAAEKPPIDVRVMSFNIRYGAAPDGENHWEKRKGLVVDAVQTFDPDLLGTQETLGFQKGFLEQRLPEYAGVGVGRDDGREAGEMTAMFYKTDRFEPMDEGHFWLSEQPDKPGSVSWDSSMTRMCSWVKLRDRKDASLRPVLWLNSHLDHVGATAREESAKLIAAKVNELGEGCDVIVTGDFNCGADSPPYRALYKDGSGFVDTYAAARPEDEPGEATFNSFRGPVVEGPRIDWIAARGDWQVISAGIDRSRPDGRFRSDHYPVHAVLRRTLPQ